MASIVLVERLRNGRITFEIVLNHTVLGFAEPGKAFQLTADKLANLRLSRTSRSLASSDRSKANSEEVCQDMKQRTVAVAIEGRLGRDTEWQSFGDFTPSVVVRRLFCGWYTQAVQAQAALVRQQIQPRV